MSSIQSTVIIFFVFSEQSFRNIPKWITEADQHILHTDVPRLLVGTKNDLESQEVIRQRAQRFADANFLPLFEVSAKVRFSRERFFQEPILQFIHFLRAKQARAK